VSLAADTRAAIRRHPFLREALSAGVLNYAAAARLLDIDGEESAVVAALRRYAEELPAYEERAHEARVTMRSGLGERSNGSERVDEDAASAENGEAVLLRIGDRTFVPGTGARTGVLATGAVDTTALAHVLRRLATEGIAPVAAGVAGEALLVVVSRSDGPGAVRAVESALDAVPISASDRG
jgi:Arc/MetJ family transcription regulator